MIKPTVGRVVWYYEEWKTHKNIPFAATICYVHLDNSINVGGLEHNGTPFRAIQVLLVDNGDSFNNDAGVKWACYAPDYTISFKKS